MEKIKIAIATHKRSDIIQKKTLKLLEGLDYEITIFANPKGEAKEYKKVLGDKYKIVEIEEYKTIGNLRNQMLNYYKKGDKIIMIDDDIGSLRQAHDNKLVDLDKEAIKDFIDKSFNFCEKHNIKARGIYPVPNAFFMSKKINYKHFLINCFMGIIKTDINYDKNLYSKEDYDFTLQNIVKYGAVARMEFITTDNKYGKTKGGLQANPIRKEKTEQDIQYLKQKRGDKIKDNPRRPGEILFNS